MAAPDPSKLVALYEEFAGDVTPDDVPAFLARVADEAVSAASLDPPGKSFNDGDTAPGHRAAVGLVIAAGNYAWMRFPEEGKVRDQVVDFTTELLERLGVPAVHGWRQN